MPLRWRDCGSVRRRRRRSEPDVFAVSRYHAAEVDPIARRRRLVALLLALAVHGGVVLMLLRQQFYVPMRESGALAVFNIDAPPAPKAKKAQPNKANQAERAVEPPRPRPPAEPVETPPVELPFMQLSRADLAASDIGKMESRKPATGQTGITGPAIGPGEGPGGRQLFNAQWYRRPTNAELSGYLPANAPRTGWGVIACQTIEHYEVENCRALGEFPLGSGFARAVRQAAWQFRVIPPRVDGKPMIGTWVRIRIEYTNGAVVED
jgi:hypothetical protein